MSHGAESMNVSGGLTPGGRVDTVAPSMSAAAPSPSSTSPLVRANGGVHVRTVDVRKAFKHGERQLEVLRGINFELRSGEIAAVVGASGVGKSTLLHLLGTLDLPTSGQVIFDGEDVTKLSHTKLADFRNQHVGFVFQFHHLLPEFTALENAMMPGLIKRLPRNQCEARATEILTRVGLAQRLTHRPGELSGGEQQRVALARALFLKPRLLLADEPTGNLDTRTSREMHQMFFDLNQELGMTILLVTHNDELAAQVPRRLKMVDGVIEEANV
ncbi:MAG: ABC transporter ATP-binding protein [Deltaproteobacteria bacterium]|nr:ABC transporter ATP-binding protein [Deltaproteobacteria bacterium]